MVMVIVEKRPISGEFEVRTVSKAPVISVHTGIYPSLRDVFEVGFDGLLKRSVRDEMIDHLDIKGFYKFDPTDAFDPIP